MFTFGSQIGHFMFRGSIAEYWGIINIPVADRRFFFDYGVKFNLTSIMKVDRIENLSAFAHKVRNHFMQHDRFRSRVISFGTHVFFEKV